MTKKWEISLPFYDCSCEVHMTVKVWKAISGQFAFFHAIRIKQVRFDANSLLCSSTSPSLALQQRMLISSLLQLQRLCFSDWHAATSALA